MARLVQCPIGCGNLVEADAGPIGERYDCPRCGPFELDPFLEKAVLPGAIGQDPRVTPALSYAIRRMNRQGARFPLVPHDLVERLARDPRLPNPAEQAANVLLHLGDERIKRGGNLVPINPFHDCSLLGFRDNQECSLLLHELENRNLIKLGAPSQDGWVVNLTLDGWERYEQLQRGRSESRRAFMAMKFANAELDRVVTECFKPAVSATGFDLVPLNEEPKAGLIDNRMRVDIRTSRFLVADLTHENPGAYWEGGFAEGLGKPVIYTCRKDNFERVKTHFDVNHSHHVLWMPDRLKEAEEELKATIRNTLPEEAKMEDG